MHSLVQPDYENGPLAMGTATGVISWRLFGIKQPSVEGVPRQLRERVLAEYSDFLERKRA